jgi:hypothetical protein
VLRVELDDIGTGCVDCEGPEGVMRPGGVPFDAGSRRTVSFTFIAGNPPGDHGTGFRVQLRPTTEAPVTVHKGSLSVFWNDLDGACA